MACFENPDGTITCTDMGMDQLVNLVGRSNWPAKPPTAEDVQKAMKAAGQPMHVILIKAKEVEKILGDPRLMAAGSSIAMHYGSSTQ